MKYIIKLQIFWGKTLTWNACCIELCCCCCVCCWVVDWIDIGGDPAGAAAVAKLWRACWWASDWWKMCCCWATTCDTPPAFDEAFVVWIVVENGTGGLVPNGPIVTVVLPFAAATNPLVLNVAILAAIDGSFSTNHRKLNHAKYTNSKRPVPATGLQCSSSLQLGWHSPWEV